MTNEHPSADHLAKLIYEAFEHAKVHPLREMGCRDSAAQIWFSPFGLDKPLTIDGRIDLRKAAEFIMYRLLQGDMQ